MSRELPLLDARLLSRDSRLSAALTARAAALPERVLQFGEGNFLRGFCDWMLERMNQRGVFQGRAVIVQPIEDGACQRISRQDGLYTVLLRGTLDKVMAESREIVTSVSRCIDPHRDFSAFMRVACAPELRFVISNTTEAGIRTHAEDALDARPARSFPAKLTQVLYARFRHFDGDPARGLVMLPCELIERNGDALARSVLELAARWELPGGFARWVTASCAFTNTLVDRIITGYPQAEAEELAQRFGYRDELIVAGELFHAWVIESPWSLENELPLAAAGLNVTWTRDMVPYRERKVRILNGAHTLMALPGFLAGRDTVRQCMEDPLFRAYVEGAVYEEILPTLNLPATELSSFAESVLERFESPFIHHQLLSISLNSVSKYKARLLCTALDNERKFGKASPRLAFGLASLIAFYRGREIVDGALLGVRDRGSYPIKDDPGVLEFFLRAWRSVEAEGLSPEACVALAREVLARTDFWGPDVTDLAPELAMSVAEHLYVICTSGVRPALQRVLDATAR